MRQVFKPDKLILWLAKDQFPDKKVHETLIQLQKRGLTIEFCEDLRSHKKYYNAMKKFPESCIITLDDDLYYDRQVLKNVVELHRKFPGMITTNRAHKITFNGMKINPYRKWKHNVTDINPSHFLVSTGGSGTLYPPGTLHEDAFSESLIKRLCFHADDIWLKIMALKKKYYDCNQ